MSKITRKEKRNRELREIAKKAKKWGIKIDRKSMSKRTRRIYDEATGPKRVHGFSSFKAYEQYIKDIGED